jgi:hypothetical protein
MATAQDADPRDPGKTGPGLADGRQPGPGSAGADRPTPDCLDEDDLRHLAAGLSPPDQAAKLTQHASQCDHCGPLLRTYIEDFSDELSPEDEALLGRLKSSSAGWQKKVVQEMLTEAAGASAAKSKKTFSWRWLLAPVALAACAALAFAIWYSRRDTPEKVEKLLAQAYTEQRTMEMRWPGAKWAPVRVTRGNAQPRFSRPATLLQAEAIIAREQRRNRLSSEWSNLQAQAELLEWHPESAVSIVMSSQGIPNQTNTDLMIALALARFEQAEPSRDVEGYKAAIVLLDHVLAKEPKNTVALFNRAIVEEQLGQLDLARIDWKVFLQYETDPAWAAEAGGRLKRLAESRSAE